jgi:hypothetical protein
LALGGHNRFQGSMADQALGRSTRQENECHSVVAGSRQPVRERRVVGSKEQIRQLHEDARTISRVLIATASAAMLKVLEDLQAALNSRVALPAAHVGHEPNSARVPLEGRVVESLLRMGGKRDASRFIAVRHEAYSLTVPAPDQSSMHLAVIEQSRGEHEPQINL